ncbi:hypothetical protein ACFQMA_15180 [Halosimplex aquaticum]|uniref:Small CPxCG-related zinc finger protein n=1 Tax=Halosimplex aquaticum TaxID=3026162 RepID=A0ABD5Y2M6_9EURY|nr:hypothetical protein [Halosimplex aquaticum]
MALTARLRSVLSDARERAGRGEGSDDAARPDEPGATDRGESRDVPETNLYECATCDTVYVAEEKSTCSTCGNAVEEVSATLSRE